MGYAFEKYYETETEDYSICIFMAWGSKYSSDGGLEKDRIVDTQVFLEKCFRGEVIQEYTFMNPLVATEFLRDELSYKTAYDALTEMQIPKESLLWKLGDKG